MVEAISAEVIMIITPIIALGTAIFNYVLDTIRSDSLKFTFSGFFWFLVSAFVYAIALGIFTYFFYKFAIEFMYVTFKTKLVSYASGAKPKSITEPKTKRTKKN